MKKVFLILIFLASAVLSYRYFSTKVNPATEIESGSTKMTPQVNFTSDTSIKDKLLFVPSWSLGSKTIDAADYTRLAYFGITVNSNGIDENDKGYKNIDNFIAYTSSSAKRYITLEMLDEEINTKILNSESLENKIINDTLAIVGQKKFDGVVLDMEMNDLLNTNVTSKINNFVQNFYTSARQNYIHFSLAIYGDVYYRKRPFDLSFLAKNSDEILIMAYNLHKSRGEPGPNFPLSGKTVYGYDLKQMLSDFLTSVPKDKLTVVFGMFGYDWSVDEKQRNIKPAEAISLNEIKKKFDIEEKGSCTWKNCLVKRDDLSKETEIDYVISEVKDSYGYLYYHIVWFEDEASVKAKEDFLIEQGIEHIGYWAYGYY